MFLLVIIFIYFILLFRYRSKENWKNLESWKSNTIPLKVWQTYKTNKLSDEAKECQQTWLEQKIPYEFMDDQDIDKFMKKNFNKKTYDTFKNLPLGVMKADMWRYCVLYINGGIYSDIDTKCVVPVKDWEIEKQERMIVCLENDSHFCQWTIVSCKGHPVLKTVIDLIVERASKGIDISEKHFVHKHTGPGIWTEALRKCLNVPENKNARDIFTMYRNSQLEFLFSKYQLRLEDKGYFNGRLVKHYYGSRNFKKNYDSWIEQRTNIGEKSSEN